MAKNEMENANIMLNGEVAEKEYYQFITEVQKCLQKSLPDKDITIMNCRKYSKVLWGLTIRDQNSSVAPVLYMEEFYKKYKEGIFDLSQVAKDVLHFYNDSQKDSIAFDNIADFVCDFERVKSNIQCKLIPAYQKEEIKKGVWSDGAEFGLDNIVVAYYINVSAHGEKDAYIRINDSILTGSWHLSIDELKSVAVENITLSNTYLSRMCDIVYRMMKENCQEEDEEMFRDMYDLEPFGSNYKPEEDLPLSKLQQIRETSEDMPMYILTNDEKRFGANVLLKAEILEKVYSLMDNQTFFILPSSIHELIILKDDESISVSVLRNMVSEVNTSQVAEDEILSEDVYIYDGSLHVAVEKTISAEMM